MRRYHPFLTKKILELRTAERICEHNLFAKVLGFVGFMVYQSCFNTKLTIYHPYRVRS